MNLLLTNDDGFKAQGINVLFDRLSMENDLNVFMVAPESNRSSYSHKINMSSPNFIKPEGKNKWSCSGSPADCVLNTLRSSLLPCKIDAVISGINHGANIGTDIIYSGTCAAAREAALENIPGIALSLEFVEKKLFGFQNLADFTAKNIHQLVDLCKKSNFRSFLNINMYSSCNPQGAKLTDVIGTRVYKDSIGLEPFEQGFNTVFHAGTDIPPYEPESDFEIARQGYISMSLVRADPVAVPVQVIDGIRFSL